MGPEKGGRRSGEPCPARVAQRPQWGMSDSPAPSLTCRISSSTPSTVRDVVILGSTGSIGTQAINIVLRNPDRFRVTALSAAGGRVALLAEQAHRLRVRTVAVAREDVVPALREALTAEYASGETLPEIVAGADAATQLAASDCHTVLNGITGSIGLAPTLAALEAGRTLALANKESLIVGGPLGEGAGQARPDHPGALRARGTLSTGGRHARRCAQTGRDRLRRTPLGRTKAELANVTPAEALAHPTWAMGPVITINSATLVNKGLEVIEAHLLYDIPFDRIEVVVHPQSYVHSMVEYTDGSTLAQATPPDMRGPIAIGLGWPNASRTRRPPSTGPRRRAGSSSARQRRVPPSGSPGTWGSSRVRPRRCSMPPTRSAWTRS